MYMYNIYTSLTLTYCQTNRAYVLSVVVPVFVVDDAVEAVVVPRTSIDTQHHTYNTHTQEREETSETRQPLDTTHP